MTPQRQHEDIIEQQRIKILNLEKMLAESERLRIRGEQFLYSLFRITDQVMQVKGLWLSGADMMKPENKECKCEGGCCNDQDHA